MASVLNTSKTIDAIENLIHEARDEVILITPFLNERTERLWNAIERADQEQVRILLICRVAKMGKRIKSKLKEIHNLVIVDDPDVHMKCYINEDSLISSSMNLYERESGSNNELSMLFEKSEFEDTYYDVISEVRDIINSSRVVKRSAYRGEPFTFQLLKYDDEIVQEHLDMVNKVSSYKQFTIEPDGWDEKFKWTSSKIDTPAIKSTYQSNFEIYLHFLIRDPYYDSKFTIKRIEMELLFGDELNQAILSNFKERIDKKEIEGFQLFIDSRSTGRLTIYRDWKNYDWRSLTFEQGIERYFNCLPEVFRILKELEKDAISELEETSTQSTKTVQWDLSHITSKLSHLMGLRKTKPDVRRL